MKYVLIGNSTAAIGAVEGIRRVDAQGEITIITDEPHHTYSRPLISYLLGGRVTLDNMKYRPDSFYTDNNCTLLAGVSATKIHAARKQVTLANGQLLDYDKLLVATGSSAFVPPFPGLDTVNCKHTFMSLDDAHGLQTALAPAKRVLIIGAGLIGLKCAEGLLGQVAGVTVVDMAPQILSSILDEGGASMVQSHLEKRGITFRLACSVTSFESDTAVLHDGETIDFDLLVLAVGVRPNTALLDGIAEIDRGIVINEHSATSATDIYAAGDCTQTVDISCGQNKIMALLPNAYMQGTCAGINMAGGTATFDQAIPMNAIGFCGLHIITAGNYAGEIYANDDDGNYKRLFYSGNQLHGYILIGSIDKAGIYTDLIRERTPLDSIDFDLICQNPGLMAFSPKARAAKLGETR